MNFIKAFKLTWEELYTIVWIIKISTDVPFLWSHSQAAWAVAYKNDMSDRNDIDFGKAETRGNKSTAIYLDSIIYLTTTYVKEDGERSRGHSLQNLMERLMLPLASILKGETEFQSL